MSNYSFVWRVIETTVVQLTSSAVGKGLEKVAAPAIQKAKDAYAEYRKPKEDEALEVPATDAVTEMKRLGKDNKDL